MATPSPSFSGRALHKHNDPSKGDYPELDFKLRALYGFIVWIALTLGLSSIGEAGGIPVANIVKYQCWDRHIAMRCIKGEAGPTMGWIASADGGDESSFVYFPFKRDSITRTSNKNGHDERIRLNVVRLGRIGPTSLHIGTTNWVIHFENLFLSRENGSSAASFARSQIGSSPGAHFLLFSPDVAAMRTEQHEFGVNHYTNCRRSPNIFHGESNDDATTFRVKSQIAGYVQINRNPRSIVGKNLSLHNVPLPLKSYTLRTSSPHLRNGGSSNNASEKDRQIGTPKHLVKYVGVGLFCLGAVCMIAGIYRGCFDDWWRLFWWFALGAVFIIIGMEHTVFGAGRRGIFLHGLFPNFPSPSRWSETGLCMLKRFNQ